MLMLNLKKLIRFEGPLQNISLYLKAKNLNHVLLAKIGEKEEILKSINFKKIHTFWRKEQVDIKSQNKKVNIIKSTLEKNARLKENILITGESFTGKKLFAKYLLSRTSVKKDFVYFDCKRLDEQCSEDYHSCPLRSAIHDAKESYLVIDHLESLSLKNQKKFLNLIKEMRYENIRLISLANSSIFKKIEDITFNKELFYTLHSSYIKLPKLSERAEDVVPTLINMIQEKSDAVSFNQSLVHALTEHAWEGNFKELENMAKIIILSAKGNNIGIKDLPQEIAEKIIANTIKEEVDYNLSTVEKEHIKKTIEAFTGNKTKTARALGITVKTLYNKMKSYNII